MIAKNVRLERLTASAPLLAICLAVIGCAFGAAGQGTRYRIAANELAGLPISPSTPFMKFKSYGPLGESRTTFGHMSCQLFFPAAKLTVRFSAFLSPTTQGTPATCTFFYATVRSAQWTTPQGLRVGDTVATMRHLYPRSVRLNSTSNEWFLSGKQGSVLHTVLVAFTAHRRVNAVGIDTVGH